MVYLVERYLPGLPLRGSAALAERDRITSEYRALMPQRTRQVFDQQLALART